MILMKGVEIIETYVTITAKFKIHIYLFAQKAIIIKLGFLLFAIFISFYKVFFLKNSIYSLTGLCVYIRHGDPPSLPCLFIKPSGKC